MAVFDNTWKGPPATKEPWLDDATIEKKRLRVDAWLPQPNSQCPDESRFFQHRMPTPTFQPDAVARFVPDTASHREQTGAIQCLRWVGRALPKYFPWLPGACARSRKRPCRTRCVRHSAPSLRL